MLKFGLITLLVVKLANVYAANFHVVKDSRFNVVDKSEIYLSEGKVNIKSENDFKVSSKDVSFSGKNSEWVVNAQKGIVEAKVLKGEVTASSPHVHTFVPVVVKAGKSIKYDVSKKAFDKI